MTRGPFDPIGVMLDRIRAEFIDDDGGQVADYIPELARADPSTFGLALAGMSGAVYQAGEATAPFTIQSVSKPFVFALALADVGAAGVLARVGVEPSGEAFNAISLEPGSGRPDNPLVNAGAIVTTSLVGGADARERFERIRDLLSRCAGRELELDQSVYESERDTGDRNRALAYLMRSAGSLTIDVDEAVDVYFRQCSVLVTTEDLALMGATLAHGGVQPRTGERVMSESVTEQVLTVMATCGMYDFSGEWLLRVGLPAKSGVSGGLIAVSPSQFGIGLHSPRLDARGNSVRAVAASAAISQRFSLHLMHEIRPSAPSLERLSVPSENQDDADISVVALTGDIEFAAVEQALLAVRLRQPGTPDPGGVVIDLDRVNLCHPAALALLEAVVQEVAERVPVVVVDRAGRNLLSTAPVEVTTLDEALALCASTAR